MSKKRSTDALQAIINEEDPDPTAGILHHDEGVDFVPGKSTLAVLDKELGNIPGGDTVLKDYVDMLRDSYEYILIDSKLAMVTLSVNVMAAADSVLIPVVTEYLPITDIEATILSVRLVQRRINRKLKIEGILLTKVKTRTILAREAEEAVRDAYEKNIRIFDSKIPLSTRVAETPALGISIYRYDPHGKAAEAYESLIVIGLLGYYAVSLILVPLIKSWIPGPAGTTISCFLQMFYVVFLVPMCAKRFEKSFTGKNRTSFPFIDFSKSSRKQ